MKKVRELLAEKGTKVWSVAPTATVLDALNVMVEKNIGAVLVMDEDRLVGIISERDHTRDHHADEEDDRNDRIADRPGRDVAQAHARLTCLRPQAWG